MSSTEQRKKIDERIAKLERRMADKYVLVFEVRNQKCFKANENEFFMLTRLAWANAIVIEHAETENAAQTNRFEDGDLFYMDEMEEEEMYLAMIREIEDVSE